MEPEQLREFHDEFVGFFEAHRENGGIRIPTDYLLVLGTESGDVTVIQKRKPRKLEPSEYSLLTLIPVGVQPNAIVVKTFMANAKD